MGIYKYIITWLSALLIIMGLRNHRHHPGHRRRLEEEVVHHLNVYIHKIHLFYVGPFYLMKIEPPQKDL